MPSRENLFTTGLIIAIALGTAGTLFYTQTALRGIHDSMPMEILEQETKFDNILIGTNQLARAAGNIEHHPELKYTISTQLSILRKQLSALHNSKQDYQNAGIRELHRALSPALQDMETWLGQDGEASNLTYNEIISMVEKRARHAYQDTVRISSDADKKAFEILSQQSEKIVAYRTSATVVLVILVFLALTLIWFIVRQQKIRRRQTHSEAILAAFMEHTPTDMVIKDRHGKYLQASSFSRKLFRATDDNIVSTMPGNYFSDQLVQEFLDHDNEIFSTGKPSEREHNLPGPDGSTVLRVLKFPVINKSGNTIAVGSIGLDITELRRSEARFRDFAEVASDWFWEIDANFRFTYISGRYEEITGIPASHMIGEIRENVLAEFVEDLDLWLERDKLIKSQQPYSIVFKMRRPDGQIRVLQAQGNPYYTSDGSFAGYHGVGTDITERQAAEEKLQESEQRFRDIATFASDYIWEMDSRLRFTFVSAGCMRVIGLSPSELIGKKPRGFWKKHMIYPEKWEEYTDILKTRNKLDGVEIDWKKPDDTHKVLKITGKPLFSEAGKFLGYRGGVSDFTEISRAQLEAEESRQIAEAANQAKTNFLANISHEIRTPMTLIIGISDILEEGKLNPHQKQLISTIKDAGDSLLTLINRILDVSKIESGFVGLTHDLFNLEEVFHIISQNYQPVLKEKGLKFSTSIDLDVQLDQLGDRFRLDQIFRNLIDNAIKFTATGEINISVKNAPPGSDPRNLLFSVADTGIGISKNMQTNIFEAFIQQDDSTTRKYGGTGLGLTICRQIIDVMGGRIWVESEPGKGSRFNFTALFDGEVPTEQPQLAAKSSTSTKGRKLSIMLVEDDALISSLIQELLQDTPHKVISATNGEEAVETFKKTDLDLVLMDLRMPIMDGYSATRQIRTWEKSNAKSAVPIIALSASVLTEDIERCLSEGFTTHLSKPVRKAHLIQTINQFRDHKIH